MDDDEAKCLYFSEPDLTACPSLSEAGMINTPISFAPTSLSIRF